MRPVQTLYYDHGQIHCPVHGKRFIKFMTNDGADRKLYWYCAAMLPDGNRCIHSAEWNSVAEIHDVELEALAIEYLQGPLS